MAEVNTNDTNEKRILGYGTAYRILKVERGPDAWALNLKIRYCDTRSRSHCQRRHTNLMKENSFIIIFMAAAWEWWGGRGWGAECLGFQLYDRGFRAWLDS